MMVGIGSGYGVSLVLGLPPSWGSPLEQAQGPGPESAPLELSQEDWFLLAPLYVAGPSGVVAPLSPLENGGDELSVQVRVNCEGAILVVPNSLGYHYLPNRYRYPVGL